MWTADQTSSFLEWARSDDHRHWVAWAFIATSGDWRGANLGLRWQDIDFDQGTAAFIWTVTCVNNKLVVKPYGKTGENHAIILDQGTSPSSSPGNHARTKNASPPAQATNAPHPIPTVSCPAITFAISSSPNPRRLPLPRTIQPRIQTSPGPRQP